MVNLAGTPTVGNPHSKKWAARPAREPGDHDPGPRRRDRRLRRAGRRSSPATRSATTATTATSWSPRQSDSRGDSAADRDVPRTGRTRPIPPRGRRPGVRAAHRTGHGPRPARRSSSCGCCSRPGWAPGSATAGSTSRWSRCATGSAPSSFLAEHDTAQRPVQHLLPARHRRTRSSPRRSPGRCNRPAFLFAPAPVLKVGGRRRSAPELLGLDEPRPAALEDVGLPVRRPRRRRRARRRPGLNLRHPPLPATRTSDTVPGRRPVGRQHRRGRRCPTATPPTRPVGDHAAPAGRRTTRRTSTRAPASAGRSTRSPRSAYAASRARSCRPDRDPVA